MKPKRQELTLERLFDWPFLIFLAAACIALALFHSLQGFVNVPSDFSDLPKVLQNKLIKIEDVLTTSEKINFSLRIFSAWLIAFFLSGCFFSFAVRATFFNLRKNAQRLLICILYLVFFLLSYYPIIKLNSQWTDGAFNATSSFVSQSMLTGIKTTLISVFAVLFIFRYLTFGEKLGGKILRFFLLAALIGVWLVRDWRESRIETRIAPENKDKVHTFVFVVPDMNLDEIRLSLEQPALKKWKENTRLLLPVMPSSPSFTAQIASLVSGLEPFEHGIRFDFMHPDDFETLEKHLRTQNLPKGKHLHATSLGAYSSGAHALKGLGSTNLCLLSAKKLAVANRLRDVKVPFALLPDAVFKRIFPEYVCSSHFYSGAVLLRDEFLRVGNMLSTPGELTSFWLLDKAGFSFNAESKTSPKSQNAEIESVQGTNTTGLLTSYMQSLRSPKTSEKNVSGLADLLDSIGGYLELFDPQHNSRVILVTLAKDSLQPGAMALFQSRDTPFVPRGYEGFLTPPHIAKIIAGKSLNAEDVFYTESFSSPLLNAKAENLRFQGNTDDWLYWAKWENDYYPVVSKIYSTNSIYFGDRTILCPFKIGDEFFTSEISFHPNRLSSMSVDFGEAKAIRLFNESLSKMESCPKYAIEQLRKSIQKDVALTSRNELLDYLDARKIRKNDLAIQSGGEQP
jgi:hypothetical protein